MGILVNENQIGGGTSNSSHNIGDIFYTTRTDNSLNGAVECNGSQYNFSDFDSNLQALFDEGKLPYVSIGKFDSMVTNQGGCDSFGYGTGKTLYALKMEYSLLHYYTDINVDHPVSVVESAKVYDLQGKLLEGWYLKYDNTLFGILVYDNEDEQQGSWYDVFPDETIESNEADTPTTYFKVPKKLSRVLVRTQKPTVDNDYTWYNLYADGWVEQGGKITLNGIISDNNKIISLPVRMESTKYYSIVSQDANAGGTPRVTVGWQSTTKMTVGFVSTGGVNGQVSWEVKGYADLSEYLKNKWDYQNVQVERCMVQLFNSTTDTAVATCNQVLADVSALNQGDYVVYWDSYEASNHSHAYTGITLDEYQWYRIYKSGWVEQGGFNRTNGSNATRITIPVEMKTVNYTPVIQGRTEENGYMNAQWQVMPVNNTTSSTTTTSFVAQGSITGYNLGFRWQVSGFSFLA